MNTRSGLVILAVTAAWFSPTLTSQSKVSKVNRSIAYDSTGSTSAWLSRADSVSLSAEAGESPAPGATARTTAPTRPCATIPHGAAPAPATPGAFSLEVMALWTEEDWKTNSKALIADLKKRMTKAVKVRELEDIEDQIWELREELLAAYELAEDADSRSTITKMRKLFRENLREEMNRYQKAVKSPRGSGEEAGEAVYEAASVWMSSLVMLNDLADEHSIVHDWADLYSEADRHSDDVLAAFDRAAYAARGRDRDRDRSGASRGDRDRRESDSYSRRDKFMDVAELAQDWASEAEDSLPGQFREHLADMTFMRLYKRRMNDSLDKARETGNLTASADYIERLNRHAQRGMHVADYLIDDVDMGVDDLRVASRIAPLIGLARRGTGRYTPLGKNGRPLYQPGLNHALLMGASQIRQGIEQKIASFCGGFVHDFSTKKYLGGLFRTWKSSVQWQDPDNTRCGRAQMQMAQLKQHVEIPAEREDERIMVYNQQMRAQFQQQQRQANQNRNQNQNRTRAGQQRTGSRPNLAARVQSRGQQVPQEKFSGNEEWMKPADSSIQYEYGAPNSILDTTTVFNLGKAS